MVPSESARYLPLTPVQQGMVFEHLSAGQHEGLNIEQLVCDLRHRVDPDLLEKSWCSLVEKTPLLRAAVDIDSDPPRLAIRHDAEPEFEYLDWRPSGNGPADPEQAFAALLVQDRTAGFDITLAPIHRIRLIRLSDDHYRCVWTLHHLLLDGRSFSLALIDLFDAYDQLAAGSTDDVPARPDFAAYLDWRAALETSESRNYWRELLGDVATSTSLRPAQAREENNETSAGTGETVLEFDPDESARLSEWARSNDATVNALVQTAWAALHNRYTGADTVVHGSARAGRAGTVEDAQNMLGVFITTTPVRVDFDNQTALETVRTVRQQHVAVRDHEHVPLVEIQAESAVPTGAPVFESLVVFDRLSLNDAISAERPGWTHRYFEFHEKTPFPFTLYGFESPALRLKLAYDMSRFSSEAAQAALRHLQVLIRGIVAAPEEPITKLPLLTDNESAHLLKDLNSTRKAVPGATLIRLLEAQVGSTSKHSAVKSGGVALSYAELDQRASGIARLLADKGVRLGDIVGVSLPRSAEMLAAVIGVMKAGGAYLPLDPEYPRDRTLFCLRDSQAAVILTTTEIATELGSTDCTVIRLDEVAKLDSSSGDFPDTEVQPGDLAYVIYTSGSTGKPKGVQITHANVVNFFSGMDDVISTEGRKTWLAVTSLSFDISVLELLWTLARGFTVVLAGSEDTGDDAHVPNRGGVQFSLFYFASDPGGAGRDKYRLILEGARFADQHGFEAIWTPERHFHSFGGLYPNPSVIGAAVAAITDRLGIRAGSVVLPLHHPLRVVEEWSLVDNLCDGRVGLSFASGWQPNDFVLAPDKYETRREDLYPGIEAVRSLWRGDKIALENPKGDTVEVQPYPQPVQKELPIWVTAAGSEETFRKAGEIGANLLTHLLGQTLEEVGRKIEVYRQARRDAGYAGSEGRVTLMMHTFVGLEDEAVREQVREPMKSYLKSAASLVAQYADAWTAYKQGGGSRGTGTKEFDDLDDEELDDLVEFAFERYFETSALFGTPEKCAELVDNAHLVGVDEIACLIDFGVDHDAVLDSLKHLNTLKVNTQRRAAAREVNISELIARHNISHLQCTPSSARSIFDEEGHEKALRSLDHLMIGGEAFPSDLWMKLRDVVNGRVTNMYGPTETTIWSTTCELSGTEEHVAIGRPIANTRCYVLDNDQRLVPEGVPGELYIAGSGVARGYLNRPELTAERFVDDPFEGGKARMYRTGDIVRWNEFGKLDFLGRVDHQVKIRGFRVELGEIEQHLAGYDGIDQSVVVAHRDNSGLTQLVAYCTSGNDSQVAPQSIAAYLRNRLPDYMVPSQFLFIDEFPLTPNRKIDRGRLPSPESLYEKRPREESRAPANEIETSIKAIWESVLGLSDIGLNDNFFDIGGHSLRAVQVQGRLRETFNRRFPITDIFRFPTIEAFATYIGGDAQEISENVDARAKRRRAARARKGRRGKAATTE